MYTEVEGRKQEELLTACDYPDDRSLPGRAWHACTTTENTDWRQQPPPGLRRPRMPIDGRKWRPRGGRATSSSRCSFHASTFLNVCLLDHLSPLPLVQRIPARPLSVSTVVKPSVRACMCALDTSWKCTRLCKVIERWRNIRFFYSVRFDVNAPFRRYIYIYIIRYNCDHFGSRCIFNCFASIFMLKRC